MVIPSFVEPGKQGVERLANHSNQLLSLNLYQPHVKIDLTETVETSGMKIRLTQWRGWKYNSSSYNGEAFIRSFAKLNHSENFRR